VCPFMAATAEIPAVEEMVRFLEVVEQAHYLVQLAQVPEGRFGYGWFTNKQSEIDGQKLRNRTKIGKYIFYCIGIGLLLSD